MSWYQWIVEIQRENCNQRTDWGIREQTSWPQQLENEGRCKTEEPQKGSPKLAYKLSKSLGRPVILHVCKANIKQPTKAKGVSATTHHRGYRVWVQWAHCQLKQSELFKQMRFIIHKSHLRKKVKPPPPQKRKNNIFREKKRESVTIKPALQVLQGEQKWY